ncbi:MAG: ABC transporter permease [Lachnospiraceae bacterium]|nr:ABC transporter permease [Lachnospiraceae bacterium]
MYFRILKKDLNRKRAMNIIVLMFIILATTFVSSSVNNIITVVNALDSFFEKAGVRDYLVATADKVVTSPITDILDNIEVVDGYGIEHIVYLNSDNILCEGEQLDVFHNSSVLNSFEDTELTYFDSDNKPLEGVEPGKVYISGKKTWNAVEIGDMLEISIGDVSETFEVAGSIKDAVLGSDMMGMTRFIINEKDFEKYISNEKIKKYYSGSLCYISTSDTRELERQLSVLDNNIVFLDDSKMLKMTYVMDMIIAGILLVVSVCLILIAFVVLRFTISFVLTEEYREIGVMKAIGIGSVKIRGLYMVKYFMLALLGTMIGLFASIPFGKMLLNSVSQTMVMEAEGGLLINLLCAIGVVAVILLFCFRCTKKVNSFTPVDAIRNGVTGERFRKKSILRLHRSSVKPAVFLAANDVLSSPGRFASITLTFTICLLLVLILVNSVNTLKSSGLVTTFALTESDVYLDDSGGVMAFLAEDGRELFEEKLKKMEETLAENGMPAKCSIELMLNFALMHGDNICKSRAMQGIGTTADQYLYYEGTPPQNAQEIAVTKLTAEKLGVGIGDRVIIRQLEGEKEYMITALFQSMNNMGEGIRFHESCELNFIQAMGFFPYQINFTDNPDKEEVEKRIEKIKEIYNVDTVYDAGGYVNVVIGSSDIIDSIRVLVLMVVMIIIVMVTVLMERSFIARERGEIAILKAMGIGNGIIVWQHVMRFAIVSIISTVIALILLIPATIASIGPVFNMMGANYGVKYEIVPVEVYLIYPLIVLFITVFSAFLTALYTRTISASESAGIE